MPEPQQSQTALLAGASGLVGANLLAVLLATQDFSRVYAITRRPLRSEHPRLANRTLQFDDLAQLAGITCQAAFCCLGSTLRAAGSEEAFRRVDLEYVLAFAHAAKAAQVQRFIVVSAAGADAQSRNFYLRTKGETEQSLALLGFQSLHILQPAVLLGWRRERRPFELIARVLMPLAHPFLVGARVKYRAIAARTVAHAMLGAARSGRRGLCRYTYADMVTLAGKTGLAGAL
jgi:uncharacterized protein YbjT (DUF2867 family)